MPSRISAWAVYDVFTVKNDEQIFLAVVSDTQWAIFCDAFGLPELKADPRLRSNNDRVSAREWLMPVLRAELAGYSAAELSALFEANGLPFAPITRPHDLFDDPHLTQTGGLAPMILPDGRETLTALLPLTLDGERLGVRLNPPKLGEHSVELLRELGYSEAAIHDMQASHIVQ
jgi:crotonobetainyl-CoA:carnitine CoA-transferase CaiB-like acyl-CoA transferase